MDARTILQRTQRASKVKLVLKLSILGLIAVWALNPQASYWQHASQGIATTSSWVRGEAIRALGGSTETASVPIPSSSDSALRHVKAVNGFPASEIKCLALAIYFEAGNEPREAQIGVGQIALNRARTAKTPRALCKTVYNGMTQGAACLYEATCRNFGNPAQRGAALDSAVEIARGLVAGTEKMPEFAQATHFHEKKARPAWSRLLFKLASHGRLEFYSTDQPEDAVAQKARLDEEATPVPAKRLGYPRGEGQASKASAQRSGDGGALARQVFGVD